MSSSSTHKDLSPEESESDSEGSFLLDAFDSEISEFENNNNCNDLPQLLSGHQKSKIMPKAPNICSSYYLII